MAPIVSSVLRIIRASVPCQTSAFTPIPVVLPYECDTDSYGKTRGMTSDFRLPTSHVRLAHPPVQHRAEHFGRELRPGLVVGALDAFRRGAVVAERAELLDRQMRVAEVLQSANVLRGHAVIAGRHQVVQRWLVAEALHRPDVV